MPAIGPRPSSTKGKHIVLASPALPKGAACTSCKARKVRCDGVKPACGSCLRTARFEGRDESEVRCCFEGKRPSPRRSRRASGDEQPSRSSSMNSSSEVPLPFLDGTDLASALLAYTYLPRFGSECSSAPSSNYGSSSRSSFDWSSSIPASPDPFSTLDTSFTTYLPDQSLSTSPVPMLDSADYFSALNFAPSTTVSSSISTPDMQQALLLPPLDLPSLFDAPLSNPAPSPKQQQHEPSYFDMPPPIESKEWPQQGVTMTTGIDWTIAAPIPLTPEFSIDCNLLAAMF